MRFRIDVFSAVAITIADNRPIAHQPPKSRLDTFGWRDGPCPGQDSIVSRKSTPAMSRDVASGTKGLPAKSRHTIARGARRGSGSSSRNSVIIPISVAVLFLETKNLARSSTAGSATPLTESFPQHELAADFGTAPPTEREQTRSEPSPHEFIFHCSLSVGKRARAPSCSGPNPAPLGCSLLMEGKIQTGPEWVRTVCFGAALRLDSPFRT